MDAIGIPAPLPRVMIKGEQIFFDKRVQKLDDKERIATRLVMDQLRQWCYARRLAVKRLRDQLPDMHTGERRQRDLIDLDARVSDGLELDDQRMRGIDLVVPVGADQHQVPQVRAGQQILEQVERCGVEPLQIVEKERKRMFRPGKYTDETPEHEHETALRLLRLECRDGWRLTDNQLQFGDEVGHEPG